jgi:hypothetical protein
VLSAGPSETQPPSPAASDSPLRARNVRRCIPVVQSVRQ